MNSHNPTALGVRAVDAKGDTVPDTPVEYQWAGGDSVVIDPSGTATCARSGNAEVLAKAGSTSLRLIVQCRLVEYVRLPGPFQFILGDSLLSQPLPVNVEAYDGSGQRVSPIVASIRVTDTTIATLRGQILTARVRGITTIGARSGDRDIGTGVHVYQRVASLMALDTLLQVAPRQRLFAIPLHLESGEYRRQRLPPGSWMLTMLPESDTAAGRTRLRVEGGRCQEHLLNTPRRWGCTAGTEASVTVYREPTARGAPAANSYLLVRWLFT